MEILKHCGNMQAAQTLHASLLMAFNTVWRVWLDNYSDKCLPTLHLDEDSSWRALRCAVFISENKPRPWSGWNIILQKSHDWISEEHFLTEQKLKKPSDCSHHVSRSRSGRAKFAEASTKQFSIILEFVVGVMMKAGPYLTEGHCLLVDAVQSESSKGSFECGSGNCDII